MPQHARLLSRDPGESPIIAVATLPQQTRDPIPGIASLASLVSAALGATASAFAAGGPLESRLVACCAPRHTLHTQLVCVRSRNEARVRMHTPSKLLACHVLVHFLGQTTLYFRQYSLVHRAPPLKRKKLSRARLCDEASALREKVWRRDAVSRSLSGNKGYIHYPRRSLYRGNSTLRRRVTTLWGTNSHYATPHHAHPSVKLVHPGTLRTEAPWHQASQGDPACRI